MDKNEKQSIMFFTFCASLDSNKFSFAESFVINSSSIKLVFSRRRGAANWNGWTWKRRQEIIKISFKFFQTLKLISKIRII